MPVLTTAAITALVTSIAKNGLDKILDSAKDKLTDGAFNWFKSIFFENEKPKQIITNLQEKPESEPRTKAVEALLEMDLEENPQNEVWLREVYTKTIHNENNITNSKNVNTGNVNTGGGNFHIGDINGTK